MTNDGIVETIKEISEQLNTKPENVYCYNTPTYKAKTSEEKARRLVKL